MARLTKIKYTNSKGERKINCYLATIPKAVVKKARIEDNDEVVAYEEYGRIIIEKKYHCECMECGFEWESGEAYNCQTACPRCKVGDIHYDINGGYNDNQEQRTKKDA